MRHRCRTSLFTVLVALVALAPSTAVPLAASTPASLDPGPRPPDPDPAALARMPEAPTAIPGAVPAAPCPAGVAPSGLDAFSGTAAEAPLPGAPPPGAGAGVLVALVDTGVAPHPRLAGRVSDGGDFVAGRSALDDCDGHGTAVAGLIAAAPSGADLVQGRAPAARLLAVRQASAWVRSPGRTGAGDVGTLARAVRHAAATPGVSVMTLALAGCATPETVEAPASREPLEALRAAVREATDRGVVVVAAAGNVPVPGASGPTVEGGCGPQNTPDRIATVPVPAWFDDDVLTVGAVGGAGDGRPDPASLRGPWVDVAAPGRVAASLDARGPGLTVALSIPGATPSPLVGTSFAVARVAAVAAELRRREPALPAREVAARITRTATPLPGRTAGARDPAVGSGVLDADAALADVAPAPATGPPDPAPPDPVPAGTDTGAVALVVVVLAVLAVGILSVGVVRRRRSR